MKATCIRRGARARPASFASKARIWRRSSASPTSASPKDGTRTLSRRAGEVVAPLGGGRGLVEIGDGEAVEASAAAEDLAADLGGDAGVGQHPCRHLGETGVEVREIARYADVVGAAQQLDGGADLALAALDRRKAIPLPIFERRQLQIRRIGVMVLTQIPLDAPQQPGNPPALSFQESHLEARIKFENAAEHQCDQRELHLGRMAGDVAHEAILTKARLDRRIV